jgi:hypothetical protein
VQQLAALSELFRRTLNRYRPESVAVLGVAGGNGLEHIDATVTKRVVGIDINQHYLHEVQRRFEGVAGLELYCRDLAEGDLLDLPRAVVNSELTFRPTRTATTVALENRVTVAGEAKTRVRPASIAAPAQTGSPEEGVATRTEKPGLPTPQGSFAGR